MITRLTYDVENLSRPQARHHPESHQARLECPALVLTSTTVLSQWRRDTGTCWTLRTETRQRWVACLCWWTVSTCPGCSACTCARDGAGARCRFRSACADARSTARSPDCSSSKHSLEPFFDLLQEKQKKGQKVRMQNTEGGLTVFATKYSCLESSRFQVDNNSRILLTKVEQICLDVRSVKSLCTLIKKNLKIFEQL